ncbi:MAG: alpha/beta fold hydrolase [Rubellimicrobium sp.]|nr:alpha/beta fold hydrolase [Rubellimicrobium sp.]
MPRFVRPDGTALHYTDEGHGLALLCLAGLTRNGRDFDHVVPHLPGQRILRLDARGRGLSDWPGPETYTLAHEAADAVALLDHLGIARAAILGTSRGGLQAMAIAGFAKDRLLGVALNDIGPELAPAGLSAIMERLGRLPAERTHAEAAQARAAGWTRFADVPEARWLDEVRAQYHEMPDGPDGPGGLVPRHDLRLRDAVMAAAQAPPPELWAMFDALEGLPLCLIRGAKSDLLTLETAERMARRRPDMIRAEVPGRGHVPFLDEPEALAALRAWLELMG